MFLLWKINSIFLDFYLFIFFGKFERWFVFDGQSVSMIALHQLVGFPARYSNDYMFEALMHFSVKPTLTLLKQNNHAWSLT